MKRKRKSTIHPVLKAQIRARWNSEAVSAQIHALMGADKDKLMAYGSVLFFVAGACAAHLGWTGDEPDFRIIRGAINALDDLKDRDHISDQDRGSIHAGMLAAQRVLQITPPEVIDEAAVRYTFFHAEHMKGQP